MIEIKNTKFMLMLIMIISIIAITSSSAFAATVQVNSGETSSQIQSKIDAASSGDTISFAFGGTWSGTAVKINKTLNIVGNGGTITNNNNGAAAVFSFMPITTGTGSSGSSLSSFTINAPYAVSAQDTNKITLRNLVINGEKVDKSGYNPIALQRVNTAVVDSCTINGARYAIAFNGGSGLTVTNCKITNTIDAVSMAQNAQNINIKNNNFDGNDYGVFFGGGVKNVVISQNTISNSKVYAIGMVKSASSTTIHYNNFVNNPTGVYLEQGNTAHGDPTVIGSIWIVYNNFTGSTNSAIYVNTTADTLKNVSGQILGLSQNTYENNANNILPKNFVADTTPVTSVPNTPSQIKDNTNANAQAKLAYKNTIATKNIKRSKSTIVGTILRNSGNAKSSKMYVKITVAKGLQITGANYRSVFNKNTKQWTFQMPAKKTITLKLKIKGVAKGLKKVLFNVNGKKQLGYIRVA